MRSGFLLTAALVLPALSGQGSDSPLPMAPAPRPKTVAGRADADGVIRLGSDRFRVPTGVFSGTMTTDGSGFLVGSVGRIVHLDAKTGYAIREYPCSRAVHIPKRHAVADRFLAVDAGQALRRYDTTTGQLAGAWTGIPFDRHKEFIAGDLSMTSDGTRVAFGHDTKVNGDGDPGRAWVVTFGDKPEVKEFTVLQHNRVWAVLSDDGRTLVTGGQHATYKNGESNKSAEYVQVWDVETGRERRRIWTSELAVVAGVLSPGGDRLLTLGKCEVWDVATGERMCGLRLPPTERSVADWRFSADGKEVFGMNGKGMIGVWKADTGERVREYTTPDLPPGASPTSFYGMGLTTDRTGRLFGSCRWGGMVVMWDVERRAFVNQPTGRGNPAYLLSYAADGKSLYACGGEDEIQRWPLTTDAVPELTPIKNPGGPREGIGYPTGWHRSRAFSPDRRWLALSPSPPQFYQVSMIDADSGAVRFKAHNRLQHSYLVWSGNGKWLAMSGDYGTGTQETPVPFRVLNASTGEHRLIPVDCRHTVSALFTSSSSVLVIRQPVFHVVRDQITVSVRLTAWDMLASRQLADTTLDGLKDPWGDLLAGFDEQTVFAWVNGPSGYEVVVWNVVTGEKVRRASMPIVKWTCAPARSSQEGLVAAAGVTKEGEHVLVYLQGPELKASCQPTGHQGAVRSLTFSPDGQTLATGGEDTTILLRPVPRIGR